MNRTVLSFCLFVFITFTSYSQYKDFPKLTGPYLGQKAPGTTPEVFAPGIISTNEDEYALEISPSGNEILFSRSGKLMLITKNINGIWNPPVIAPFSGKYIDGESCFSPDGSKIYFCSRRPVSGTKFIRNVWISEKSNDRWGKPYKLDSIIHSSEIHSPTIAANGNLYDTGIIKFIYENGKYSSAQKLTPLLKGISSFVAPDESYLVFSQRSPNQYSPDLFISFKNKEGKWTNPIPLGDKINSPKIEGNAFVTSDGKYLFFSRAFDIYWVDAKVIDELR